MADSETNCGAPSVNLVEERWCYRKHGKLRSEPLINKLRSPTYSCTLQIIVMRERDGTTAIRNLQNGYNVYFL